MARIFDSVGKVPMPSSREKLLLSRRRFLQLCGVSVFAGAGTFPYALFVEPHWLQMVRRRLPIANLPSGLAGRRLVQLSDIHIGPQVDDTYLLQTFRRVEATSPDLVVYTGDFITHEAGIIEHARRIIASLPHGRIGTFAILGNHDYGNTWKNVQEADRVAELVSGAGIRVLRNEIANVAGLQLVGLDDLWAERSIPAEAFRGLETREASLVLTHNPDSVDTPGWDRYSGWILAGHTHGGQCKPPFLPPPLLPVANKRYTAGVVELTGGRRLYINRGIGHLLEARFNVRPEVTEFTLERA